MPALSKKIIMPYNSTKLFDLVLDVASYPEFLPWCAATRILSKTAQQMTAEMVIKYSIFRSSYVSKIEFSNQDNIFVELIDGPFNYLRNNWHFESQGTNSTLVEFKLDFQLKSSLLENILDIKFEDYSNKLIAAFENRAQKICTS